MKTVDVSIKINDDSQPRCIRIEINSRGAIWIESPNPGEECIYPSELKIIKAFVDVAESINKKNAAGL